MRPTPIAPPQEQSLSAGPFSFWQGHLKWPAKGTTKSGLQRQNSRKGNLEESGEGHHQLMEEGAMVKSKIQHLFRRLLYSFFSDLFLPEAAPAISNTVTRHILSRRHHLSFAPSLCVSIIFRISLRTPRGAQLGAQRDQPANQSAEAKSSDQPGGHKSRVRGQER